LGLFYGLCLTKLPRDLRVNSWCCKYALLRAASPDFAAPASPCCIPLPGIKSLLSPPSAHAERGLRGRVWGWGSGRVFPLMEEREREWREQEVEVEVEL
jgi:hypothetical protein